jgi:hypothetical protein
MLKFVYELDNFAKTLNYPIEQLFTIDAIVDVELLNDISGGWQYTEAKICCVGVIHKGLITIMLLEYEGDKKFLPIVQEELMRFASEARLFSFNAGMEQAIFDNLFDKIFKIEELAPIHGKGWSMQRCYDTLMDNKVISGVHLKDTFEGKPMASAIHWQRFKETEEEEHLWKISHHCVENLLRQALIHHNRDWFGKNFKLDAKGWERGETKR